MTWLSILAYASLALAFPCALLIVLDEFRHPQKMWVMNIVWPVTALYFSIVALWAYHRFGRGMTHYARAVTANARTPGNSAHHLHWSQVAIADSHCGAGRVIGDICAELIIFSFGLSLAGSMLSAEYALDFVFAWLLGIAFQYFTIKSMRGLTVAQGLLAAIKADTFTIIAFQIGMYAWMALAYFVLFPNSHLQTNRAPY